MHILSSRLLPILVVLTVMSFGQVQAAGTLSADAKTVLITGANRGIGFEFVKQYAAAGWNVIATCRSPASADELNAFAEQQERVVVEQIDLLDHAGIDVLAETYVDQPIDVLLNNAGLMRGPDLGQMVGSIAYDEFILFYRVNAIGPLKVSEAFYKNVKNSEMKTMAALTTGKGDKGIPVPGFSLYKTSKAALDSIQHEIAIRWKRQGIKVVTLLPGRVLTHGEPAGPTNANAIPIQESIDGMITVIAALNMEQTGHTIQWDGEFIE
jgi:NAD(P)-dependent dehydrogenase (short-subunit alcohol dehydrogenase family)